MFVSRLGKFCWLLLPQMIMMLLLIMLMIKVAMNLSVDIRAAASVNMNFDIVYVCFTFFFWFSVSDIDRVRCSTWRSHKPKTIYKLSKFFLNKSNKSFFCFSLFYFCWSKEIVHQIRKLLYLGVLFCFCCNLLFWIRCYVYVDNIVARRLLLLLLQR